MVDRAALEMRCRGNSTGGSNPSFSATRNAPHWGAFAFQGQAKVTDLARRPRKAKAEQRSCALRVAGSPPPGMYKRAARRQSSFSATRNAPHWGAFALEGMSSGRMKARNAWKNSENTRPAEPPHPFEPHLNPSMIGQFGTYPRSKDRLNPCPNPFGRHVP